MVFGLCSWLERWFTRLVVAADKVGFKSGLLGCDDWCVVGEIEIPFIQFGRDEIEISW